MQIPSYGAAPLSTTFLGVRILQLICLVVILGMTGNFVNEMIMQNHAPTKEIVGTLSVTAIVTLYTLVSIAFWWSVANLGMFVMAGIDFLILIAWIVVSVSVGKPVSYLNCYFPPGKNPSDGSIFIDILANANKQGSTLSLANWSGLNKSNCFQTKAIWGFAISLAILYATSTVLLPTLHYKNRRIGGYVKNMAYP